jgi:hypothetical protein
LTFLQHRKSSIELRLRYILTSSTTIRGRMSVGVRADFMLRRLILDAVQDCLKLNQLIADEIEKLGDARDQLIERSEVLLKKYDEMFPDRLKPLSEMPLVGPSDPGSVSPPGG